jgi:hypothetical protein
MRTGVVILCSAFLVVVAACSTPTAPSQSTSSTGSNTTNYISGVVVEGTQPVAGATVDRGSVPGVSVVTDASGVFHLPAGSTGTGWLRAGKIGYVQPCATQIIGNGPITVPIVLRSALTSAPLSSPSGRTISGIVRQMTSAGSQPVAGVFVGFEPSEDFEPAHTITDANGLFSLCGLPQDTVHLDANLGGNGTDAYVPPGQTSVEFVLH